MLIDFLFVYIFITKKVTNIVTDGGSAFCKAFKLFGKSVDTLVEPVQISNEDNAIENEADPNELPFIQHEDGEPFLSNIIEIDEFGLNTSADDDFEINSNPEDSLTTDRILSDEDEFQEIQNNATSEIFDHSNNTSNRNSMLDEYDIQKLPPHRRCLSHLLNLLGKDFEDLLCGQAKRCFCATENKLQAIWVFPRKSSRAKSYSKEILGLSLLIPVVTRWNSKFDAYCRVMNLGLDKMNAYIEALKTNMNSAAHLSKLDKDDWTMINIYIKVMKPVATALDILQGEKDCGQGFILPCLVTMKQNLQSLTGGNVLKTCRDTMLTVIDKRFKLFYKIDDSNKELILASISVPRFKTDFVERDIDCNIMKEILIAECKDLQAVSEENYSENGNETEISAPNDFFISYASRRDTRRRSFDLIIEEEVKRYLEDNRIDNAMLISYPNIKNIFYRCNTTLSASAAVERVFSQSAMIFTPRRNRLLTENFERLLLVKHNRKQLMKK